MFVTNLGYYIRADGADGTFAIMTVVLLCQFTGGTVRISHADESVDLTSLLSKYTMTNVLAWYTGVTYEAEPITQGMLDVILQVDTHHVFPATRFDAWDRVHGEDPTYPEVLYASQL